MRKGLISAVRGQFTPAQQRKLDFQAGQQFTAFLEVGLLEEFDSIHNQ